MVYPLSPSLSDGNIPRGKSSRAHPLRTVRHVWFLPYEATRDILQLVLSHDALRCASPNYHRIVWRNSCHDSAEEPAYFRR